MILGLSDVLSWLGGLALAYLLAKWVTEAVSNRWGYRMGGRYDPSQLPIPEMTGTFRRTSISKTAPRYLEGVTDPVLDELLYRHARKASSQRRRMWIRYKGIHRPETERIVEVYRADVDESIFAWCCLRQEPRIFQRDRISAWCLLDERFFKDPLLMAWAEEEYPQGRDAIPWNRWRQMKVVSSDVQTMSNVMKPKDPSFSTHDDLKP